MANPALRLIVLLTLSGFMPAFCFAQSQSALVSPDADAPSAVADSLAEAPLPAMTVAEDSVQPADASLPEPAAFPPPGSGHEARVGVGVTLSTFGVGGQVAVRVASRLNVRGGFALMSLSHSITEDGINYTASLRFRSADAHLDVFLWRSFFISGGALLYNGDNVSALAAVPTGGGFSLGNASYTSGTPPIAGKATVGFNKFGPEFTFGTGNLVPRGHRHWSFESEFGVAYEGAPKVAIGFTGQECPTNPPGPCANAANDPTFAANVAAQQAKFNSQAASKIYYKLWPIISVGFGYAF